MPPDANNQQPGGTQSQGSPPSQPAEPQEPKWLSAITDQAMREEAKKSWMMQEDYTKKTQALSEQEKAWKAEKEKLEDIAKQYNVMSGWYQQEYLPFYQRIQPKWDTIDRYLKGEVVLPTDGNPMNPASPQGTDPFYDWDVLPGNEQAKRLTDHLRTTLFEPAIQQRDKQWGEFYNQKEREWAGFIQRYNAIYADAFQKALDEYKAGRSFPIQDYVNAQLEISAGKVDVPGLAYQKITGENRMKELEKEWYERGKKDYEQQLQNQTQNPGAMQNTNVPIFRQQPKTREEIAALNRKIAAEKGIPWT